MEKRLTVRSIASVAVLAVALCGLGVGACDGKSESTFDEKNDAAADLDTGPGFTPDDGSSPISCEPAPMDAFQPTWKAPTRKAVCDPIQLGEYVDACLVAQAPDAGDACKTWTAAHPECAGCIEPADNSGPIQWHRERLYFTLNVAGCLALERNEPNEGQCPAAYAASIQCQRQSCDQCFEAPNATFRDFQGCQADSLTTTCASYEAQTAPACGTDFTGPDGGAYDCFHRNDDASPKDQFIRVEGIFCGQ